MIDPVTAVGSALSSLNSAIEIARGAIGAKVDSEVRAAVSAAMTKLIDAQTQLLDARMQMHDVFDENRALKQQLRERDDWSAESAQYTLVTSPGGAIVYYNGTPPARYACPVCFQERKIHFLQDMQQLSGMFNCPACGKPFKCNVRRDPPPPRATGGHWMA